MQAEVRVSLNPLAPRRLQSPHAVFPAHARRAQRPHRRVQPVHAAAPTLRRRRRSPPSRLGWLGVLGPPRSVFRRSTCPCPHSRPRARRPRLQPDRPPVHRRWLWRFPLPRPAPGGLRLAAQRHLTRRRHAPHRSLDHCSGSLRPARQQTYPRGTTQLRSLAR